MKYKSVIFDVDGTLLDTYSGVAACIQFALESNGFEKIPEPTLRRFLGPALFDSFSRYTTLTPPQIERVVASYREKYRDGGVYDCKFYPGYPELLIKLRDRGYRICIASAKPEVFVRELMRHFGASHLFDEIAGATDEGRDSSKEGILRRVATEDSIMVGDTRYDLEAAAAVGIDAIAVTYGFGDADELKKYDPVCLASSADEIYDYLTKH